jgi:predicted ABC-type ATPase
MSPSLTVIAGCNGAGKTTFARSFLEDNVPYFNFDVNFLNHKQKLPSFIEDRAEVSDRLARLDWDDFLIGNETSRSSFAYETNFDTLPTKTPLRFKKLGFTLNMVFFCVEDKNVCRERIDERTQFNELYIPKELFEYKWKHGYKNLNVNFGLFDNLLILDNSIQLKIYKPLVQYIDKKINLVSNNLPDYFERRFPNIYGDIMELKPEKKNDLI